MNLTKPQQLIYEMEKFSGGTISVICGSMLLNGNKNTQKITTAINELYKINDALRIRISEINGNVQQTVSEYAEQDFEVLNFNSKDELDIYAQSHAMKPLDLYGSLCEFKVIVLPDKYGCLVKLHHMIGDAWTLALLGTQLNSIFNGETVQAYSYADYIESEKKYLDGKRYEKDRTFFLEQFKKCDEPTLLNEKNIDSLKSIRKTFVIEKDKAEAIRKYCSDNDSSPFMLFMSTLAIYMNRIKMNQEKFYIGTAVLNRSGAKERNTAGMFINTVPLLIELDNTKSFSENISAFEDSVMSVFRHQKFNYGDILKSIRQEYNFTEKLYDVMLSYQNAVITGNEIESTWYHSGMQLESLQIHIDDRDNENIYRIHYDYQADKFSEDDIFAIHSHICKLLFDAINNGSKKIYELEMLSDEEYQKVIFNFNDTAVDYPREKCIHELFEEQARKTPDKIALVFEDKQFTYKQLDEISNSLAHYLREEKHIQPNDIVPIIAKRSWHIIVAMLGILKAGGSYMPVSTELPSERIKHMLDETKSRFALTYDIQPDADIDIIDLKSIAYNEKTQSVDNINSANDLCYVLFTSGSTGKPKATMISHSNLGNFVNNNNNNNRYQCNMLNNCDTVLAVTTFSFDISVFEIYLSLANGLKIVLSNEEENLSAESLAKLIVENNVDVVHSTPTKFLAFLNNEEFQKAAKQLKMLMIGAEVFTDEIYNTISKYTNATIYNGYGPTETTIGVTFKRIKDKTDITIGKPIANTQIYILDKNRKPLPIGVAGELCISGDGVGKGYLNRPELTAEKFPPNPFYDEKSNPTAGKIMYCTGDLARWRVDGEIEYLGRIDTQVKIRGLRIELGEIKSVMSTFDGINMTAVTDKRDENNRQYLVGYYTSETEIDEKSLIQHLSSKLPKYMVPNYFVHLEEMPMTASGKTDRKNLPLPDFTVSQEEYIAPETETENKLCNLLAELFEVERVGVTDDFFDIGGDSLRAIEYVAKAHNVGVEFALQNVFDYPTVKTLCNFLINGTKKTVRYNFADFEKYADILDKNQIDESFVPQKQSFGNILLTGATGFLGAHVLDNLMQNELGKIYCLVRSNSPDDRRGRWPQLLNHYFGDKYDDEIGKRIIPIVGDITKVNLSDEIPNDVQTVIHTAATVKHYGSYQYFYDVNVQGTKNVVDYAKSINAKMIHISTLSVSGNSLADEFSVYRSEEEKNFYETSLFIGQPLDNVYIRSKFEAEMAVLDAVLDGLDAKIIRVGNLTNRLSDSKFQPNYESNAFLTRFKAAVELGMFPEYLLPLYAEFSPIDQTAEGVVKIAHYADKQCVFHLNSNRPIYFTRLLEVFNQLEIKMDLVSGEIFNNVLQQIAKDSKTEYIYKAFQNDMDENGQLVYDTNIHIINDFTDWFMKKVGFEWAQIDFNYIKDYVEYFRRLGYLEV